tara:strand:+ start:1797 stop:1991 length:195 start_codon:yes stop_codon:yes gene_type:complete
MKHLIKKLLKEAVSKNEKYEYQVRYIDGLIFYKRKVGEEIWSFISDEEFSKEAPGNELIKFDDK